MWGWIRTLTRRFSLGDWKGKRYIDVMAEAHRSRFVPELLGKRRCFRVCACGAVYLLMGIVCTIVVAWAIRYLAPPMTIRTSAAIALDRSTNPSSLADSQPIGWPCRVPDDWPRGGKPQLCFRSQGISHEEWRWQQRSAQDRPDSDPTYPFLSWELDYVEVGLPFKALAASRGRSDRYDVVDGTKRTQTMVFKHGYLRSHPTDRLGNVGVLNSGVPFDPLWVGLLADSVVFATVLFGIRQAFVWHRVRRRQRSDCCVHCGFSARGLPTSVCPECGRDVFSLPSRLSLDDS